MTSASIHPASRLVSAHVLVIDDDEVMRELLEAVLSAEGHSVEAVESGDAGLDRLRNGMAADVILMDVQLPGLSGPALAGQLRSAAPHAVLLGMSGSEPAREVRTAFDGFLLKPFSPEDFAEAMLKVGTPEAAAATPPTVESPSSGPAPLNEKTYSRLAASLPPAQLAELYQLTLDDVAGRLDRMQEARSAGDLAEYRREAHALKGGCSMVGAAELAALAAHAETGSFSDTPTLTDFVRAAYHLRSILAARFNAQW